MHKLFVLAGVCALAACGTQPQGTKPPGTPPTPAPVVAPPTMAGAPDGTSGAYLPMTTRSGELLAQYTFSSAAACEQMVAGARKVVQENQLSVDNIQFACTSADRSAALPVRATLYDTALGTTTQIATGNEPSCRGLVSQYVPPTQGASAARGRYALLKPCAPAAR